MNKYLFEDIVVGEEGLLKGPFGSDLKKELYVPKENDTYKVYLQENIFKEDNTIGEYYISQKYFVDKMSRYEVTDNDFIVTCDGTLGEIFQLKNIKEKGIISSSLLRIRLNNNLVDYDYFYYLFKSLIKTELITQGNNSVLKHLPGLNVIRKHTIKLPSIEEQKSISSILRLLDDKIKNNNKIYIELEEVVKTIYNYWFLQFDFPDTNGNPFKSSGGKMIWNDQIKREIPVSWQVKKISDIIDVKDGTHDSPKYITNGKYLITSKHLTPAGIDFKQANHITDEDFESINMRSKVDHGDILFSMIGAIGTVYKIDEQEINFAIKNVALYKTSGLNWFINYLYVTLQTTIMEQYIKTVMAGSIQKFIALGALRDMPIVYDQRTISNYNERTIPIFDKMSQIKKENQELTSLRDWLLPMLMNGQITVE